MPSLLSPKKRRGQRMPFIHAHVIRPGKYVGSNQVMARKVERRQSAYMEERRVLLQSEMDGVITSFERLDEPTKLEAVNRLHARVVQTMRRADRRKDFFRVMEGWLGMHRRRLSQMALYLSEMAALGRAQTHLVLSPSHERDAHTFIRLAKLKRKEILARIRRIRKVEKTIHHYAEGVDSGTVGDHTIARVIADAERNKTKYFLDTKKGTYSLR